MARYTRKIRRNIKSNTPSTPKVNTTLNKKLTEQELEKIYQELINSPTLSNDMKTLLRKQKNLGKMKTKQDFIDTLAKEEDIKLRTSDIKSKQTDGYNYSQRERQEILITNYILSVEDVLGVQASREIANIIKDLPLDEFEKAMNTDSKLSIDYVYDNRKLPLLFNELKRRWSVYVDKYKEEKKIRDTNRFKGMKTRIGDLIG